MPTPEQLQAWDRQHLWHPFTAIPEPDAEPTLIIERAEGPWLIDTSGRRYFDGVSSLWCNVHGHRVPELDDAIRQQLDRVAHSTLLGLSNVPAIELARRLVEVAPPGLTRCFFSDNGATAVEAALKMAFQYWRQCPEPRPGKTRFLSLTAAYHGDTLGAVSVGDIGLFHAVFGPLLFPTVRAPAPYCYRCPLGLRRESCGLACADEVSRLIHEHADTLAAVVIEPLVQGAAGMIVAPDGFLRRVREATRSAGVLLIADEVAVGFGRTGSLFACSQEAVTPDFLCLAKGLTGGYLPLAATLTTELIHDAFRGPPASGRAFYHGHTFTGNPLGAAVALASLERLQSGGVLAALPARTAHFARVLAEISALPHVGEVRCRGMMAGIELVRNCSTREPFPVSWGVGRAVCRRALAAGVLIRPLGDVIVLMPPLTTDEATLSWLGAVLTAAIREEQR